MPLYDGNAISFTGTFYNGIGTLQMHTTHSTAPKTINGPAEYHMTQLRSFTMTDTAGRFREGAAAYRNARESAKANRNSFIERANEAARRISADTCPSTLLDSRTSLSTALEAESDTTIEEAEAPPKRARRHAPAAAAKEKTEPAAVTKLSTGVASLESRA